jgi:uncharacterized protein (TIGR02147 family)
MINVFDYTDYRKYLEDYYEEKKASNPAFSYQQMTEKAGFNNRGFIYLLVKGQRSISKSNCFKLSQALNHDRYEEEYFENLVAFNQAKGMKEQNHFFGKLRTLKARGKGFTEMQLVTQAQYEFYSTWYHSAVRSVIDMYPFKGDYKWLARMITPVITAKQARNSVELLKTLGFITRRKNGTYALTEKNITTGKEVVGLAVQKFHVECADLAKRAIQSLPKSERHITGLTIGMSKSTYEKICEEILRFQDRIAEMVVNDDNADTAYQFNFHLYPISKTDNERTKP